MSRTGITLSDLHTAYERWAGTPVAVSELRRDEPNAHVPTEVDILYFQPSERDLLQGNEDFTFLATAGVSTRLMSGPYAQVELILRVQNYQPIEDLQALGVRLADLSIMPFYTGSYFAPNVVIRDVSFPLFEGMTCVLITHWGVHSPERLPGVTPPVLLLWLKPIYASEANVIEEIGDVEASRRFANEGVNWDVPQRPPARLA